jgi:hypothetical protein
MHRRIWRFKGDPKSPKAHRWLTCYFLTVPPLLTAPGFLKQVKCTIRTTAGQLPIHSKSSKELAGLFPSGKPQHLYGSNCGNYQRPPCRWNQWLWVVISRQPGSVSRHWAQSQSSSTTTMPFGTLPLNDGKKVRSTRPPIRSHRHRRRSPLSLLVCERRSDSDRGAELTCSLQVQGASISTQTSHAW